MLCSLCLKDTTLIKNSHIVPNFMYKGLYGEKHRLAVINLSNLSNTGYYQTGIKDKNILCANCDNVVIGQLERYASNTIYSFTSNGNIEIERYEGDQIKLPFIRYKNLDYTNIKLFFLSILWKAHVSINSFFREINLGAVYAEKLRNMILNHDGGEENEFEVVLILIEAEGTRPTQSLIEPRRLKENGNTSYVFHINEIMYHYNISKFNKLPLFEKAIIKRDGTMDIGIIKSNFARGYFDSFVGKRILMKSNLKR